jgi:hypothetical protein
VTPVGSVLGIDVGWSVKRASSAVCRLDWDERKIAWTITRFTADPVERRDAILATIGGRRLAVAAFDGPLRGDLGPIDVYRQAERRLTERWLREAIGKIAQSNSGNGRLLNAATNACARVVLDSGTLGAATHPHAIQPAAVVEAFPNSFLGLMLDDPAELKGGRGSRSDRYYAALCSNGGLKRLIGHLLPGRVVQQSPASVTNHDDRAALVCALTAVCVAAGDYTAVGDPAEGWIIMPPPALISDWARPGVAGWNQDEIARL